MYKNKMRFFPSSSSYYFVDLAFFSEPLRYTPKIFDQVEAKQKHKTHGTHKHSFNIYPDRSEDRETEQF